MPQVSRRQFLQATAGGTTVASTATEAAAQQGSSTTVKVGPGGDFVFSPGTDEPLVIAPGTTVKWVWESNNHNIVVGSQPSGSNWKGTAGSSDKTYNKGHTYKHTFDTLGKYHYWCQPHKSVGMVADVVVQKGGPQKSGGSAPAIPSQAKSVGIVTSAVMLFTLGIAYFFLKYGGDYGEFQE